MIRRVLPALIAFVLSASHGVAEDRFLFRYANAQNATDPRSLSMAFFEKELERRSNGKIQVENYYGGILGTEREIADAVAIGTAALMASLLASSASGKSGAAELLDAMTRLLEGDNG